MTQPLRHAFHRTEPASGPPRRLDLPDLATVATDAAARRPRQAAAEPCFGVDDLARAVAAAVGVEAAARDAHWRATLEARTAGALTAIAGTLAEARAAHRRVLDDLAAQAAELAAAGFRGVIAPALAELGAARLTALVGALLRGLPELPALEILCHPLDRDAVEAACRAVAADGQLAATITEDPGLDPGRVVARWADSWAELDTPGLVRDVEVAIREAAAHGALFVKRAADPSVPDPIEGEPV